MKPIFATTPTASNRSSGADMFAVDSDVDATPKVTKQPMKEQRIFNMPDIDWLDRDNDNFLVLNYKYYLSLKTVLFLIIDFSNVDNVVV